MKNIKIGFIGLGVMGYPMAGHLSKNNYELYIYNRTQSKMDDWLKVYKGNKCKSIKELAKNSDVVISCVGRDDDLIEIYDGNDGIIQLLKPGSIIIDHTTASAKIAKYFYEKCKKINLGFIDAPVSGGQAGAENGTLSVMAGGDRNDFERVLKIMSSYGKKINLIGDSGSGQICKMVNQICIAGLVQGLSEALSFGKKSNLDMSKVLEVISKGAAQSWQMDNRAKTMLNDEFDFGFAVNWMCKDLNICFDHAQSINAKLPITEIVKKNYEIIRDSHNSRWDTSSLIKLLS